MSEGWRLKLHVVGVAGIGNGPYLRLSELTEG